MWRMTEIRIEYLEKATAEAVAELNSLMKQLTTDPVPLTTRRLQMLLDAGTQIVVARDDERIVGTASVVVMRQPRGDKGWIEDVVVDDGYRGQGIARKLLAEATDCGWRLGCRSLNMSSKPGREVAQRLYESMGFTKRDTATYRLDPPARG